MNRTVKFAGTATAVCAACGALGVLPAVLTGTSVLAIGGMAPAWGLGIAALALPVAGLYALSRRKSAPITSFQTLMAAADECRCGSSCHESRKEEEPIACTLGASDYKERTASIRELARRSLRHAARTPLNLTLTYAPEARDEVRDLVSKEKTCCAFLTFDLKESPADIVLSITAPGSAAEAADMLFDHFAPELATSNIKENA